MPVQSICFYVKTCQNAAVYNQKEVYVKNHEKSRQNTWLNFQFRIEYFAIGNGSYLTIILEISWNTIVIGKLNHGCKSIV